MWTAESEGYRCGLCRDFGTVAPLLDGVVDAVKGLLTLVVDLGYVPQATAAPPLADIDQIAGMLYPLRTRVEREER